MSRSTSSTAVGEVGRGSIGAGNKEQLTWWEAAARTKRGKWRKRRKNSLQSIHTNHVALVVPRLQKPIIVGELDRVKSMQRSKSETESRKSTDDNNFEISPNQFPISNNAHTEAEAEGYHRSGDRGSSRTQSLQRCKCYTELQYSMDETCVEISSDLVED